MGQKLKLPPEAGRGLDETMKKAAGHTVTAQQRLAVNTVDVVTTSGGSFCTEPRRPWLQGGWDGWGGPGWAFRVLDAAIKSGDLGVRRVQVQILVLPLPSCLDLGE